MSNCIYCRAATDGREPEDHPVLQALGTTRALPRGDVCGACNAYLSDLDHHICNHHHIAGMIAFGQIVGTKKRSRSTVSDGFSFDSREQHLEIRGASGRVNGRAIELQLERTRDFSEWKFSRGLHRMALGILACEQGPAAALNRRFDATRDYIRRPTGRDVRKYFQRVSNKILGNRSYPLALAARGKYHFLILTSDSDVFVYMNLFVDEFVVALDGNIEHLQPDDLVSIAAQSGLPAQELSDRPWLEQPTDQKVDPAVLKEVFGLQ
jgi:hypothetical protein